MKLTIMARAFNNKVILAKWSGLQGCNLPIHLQTKRDASLPLHRIAILIVCRRSQSGQTGWWGLGKSLRRSVHPCVSIPTSRPNVWWKTSKIGLRCSSRKSKSLESRIELILAAIRILKLLRKRANSRWQAKTIMSSTPSKKTNQRKRNRLINKQKVNYKLPISLRIKSLVRRNCIGWTFS